jgi:hypothetical protein
VLRITLRDGDQTISFVEGPQTARRLVAACASRPTTIGELLVAAEVFERGIAARLMGDLMAFDKGLQREGPAFANRALAGSAAFQVVDAATEEAALAPREDGLVLVDIPAQRIHHTPTIALSAEGEVAARDREGLSERRITYVLPNEWQLNPGLPSD